MNDPDINHLSAEHMLEDELFGDRLIAANIFIDNAIVCMEKCPTFPADDAVLIDTIKVLRMKAKVLLSLQAKRYPAASVIHGEVIS
jgi:hypothetical protein